ncbi:MAG: right-handed parallel beta-helix repeat-containing protein [Bacteroidales bacterium]
MKANKFILIIGMLSALSSFAQTHIPPGYISGTWTNASSPYIIDGEIKIDTNDQLVIEPGVDVIFSGHFKFMIYGRLIAEGTETDSIHFTAQDTTLGWHGLRFDYTDFNGQDTSRLDYCKLDYGKAYGTTKKDSLGGAISCDSSSFILINNSTLSNNMAFYGGAIYLKKSDMILSNSLIQRNRTIENGKGGGIYSDAYNNFAIQNTIVENNSAPGDNGRGGGIRLLSNEFATVELIDVEIRNNFAGHKGGGICNENQNVNLIINNCKIHNNESLDYGGGFDGLINIISAEDFDIYSNSSNLGGGIRYSAYDGCTIKNVNVFDNNAHSGGGIYCWGPYTSDEHFIKNSKIYNNHANYGGGLYVDQSDYLTLEQLLVYGNSAIRGAGIVVDSSETTEFKNLTLSKNISSDEGGSFRIVNHSNPLLTGCILFNNIPDEISKDETSVATLQYSLISDGYPGTDNIDCNPLFVDPDNDNYSISWDHYPEIDTTKSPCIDTGDPLIIDPDGTRSDMGAISFEQTYSPIPAGNISGTLTCAGNPYYIFGNITVPMGEELIIEPCVYVVFQDDYYLQVDGRLVAEGTNSNKITFNAADAETGWQGIRFNNLNGNGMDSSKLVNCRILNGNADGYGTQKYGGGVYAIIFKTVNRQLLLLFKPSQF